MDKLYAAHSDTDSHSGNINSRRVYFVQSSLFLLGAPEEDSVPAAFIG
jgi:hypothetical protein